jgi:hypothetical protein
MWLTTIIGSLLVYRKQKQGSADALLGGWSPHGFAGMLGLQIYWDRCLA